MDNLNPIVRIGLSNPCSRASAIQYRDMIANILRSGSCVIVDLQKVESMSLCFADECIGVLVLEFGYYNLLKMMHLVNGNTYVVKNIAFSIRERAKGMNEFDDFI